MALEDFLHPFLGAYLASPQWVKNSVGRAYSMMPASLRKGGHYKRFASEAAINNENKIRLLSSMKLAKTLRWAIESVPAYGQYHHLLSHMGMPFDVLRALPLVSKDDIKRDLNRFLSTAIAPRQRMKVFTGGSTSIPMTFYLHKGISRTKEFAFMENFHQRTNLSEHDVVLALRGGKVPTSKEYGKPLWVFEPVKRELILSSDHLDHVYMVDYVKALQIWKPTYIQAYPSALYALARWLKKHPAPDVSERIKGVMLYSENVFDYHINLFREVFSCPVLRHYGHSERVLMAASMADDDRYFFWPQYGHFELVDMAGRLITQPGILGEIVGTGFDNQVMPFVRYRTGDMAILSNQPHPLLPSYPVVERIEGRWQEFIVCRDKRMISINSITTAAQYDNQEFEGVDAMQFEQEICGHFVIKLVMSKPLTQGARRKIIQTMQTRTQGGCTVEVVEVNEIARTARGKQLMLVQHLDIGHY